MEPWPQWAGFFPLLIGTVLLGVAPYALARWVVPANKDTALHADELSSSFG
jgi:hypothetical protein